MRKAFLSACFLFALCLGAAAQPLIKSWDGIHHSDVPTLEQGYQLPPAEYASHILWGWEGAMDAKIMKQDLDLMRNVLYSGAWQRYTLLGQKRLKKEGKPNEQ